MNKNHLVWLVLLIIITPTVLGADELFYLRGTSSQTTVESVTYNTINFIPPDATATTTTITKTTSAGINEFATWYGNPTTTGDFSLSGAIFVYFSSIGISNDTGTYRWTLYERDETGGAETQIVQSDWYTLPSIGTAHETYANIPTYIIKNGNRAKMVVEYNADTGGGTITAVVDEGNSGESVSYSASNGNNYNISGVKNVGYVLVNTSGSCSITCENDATCDDGYAITTDACINAGGCNSSCSNELTGTVACSSNAECDDSDDLTTDSCNNAGTISSSCSNNTCTISCNADSDCTTGDNGVCSNGGSCSSSCSYTEDTVIEIADDAEVICNSNNDCDDGSDLTTDICENAGTTESYCSNAQCSVACTSNEACDDGNTITNDSCVNAGTCEAACNNTSCNPICTTNSDCDDGNSATTDICAGAGRCSAVCENLTDIGNGICDTGETECSAPADCGVCGGSLSKVYENACIGNSCQQTIKLGVCGNNRCEQGEDYFSCASDCRPQNIVIEAEFPDTFYVRGETVHAKATLVVDGVKIKDATIRAEGFFGGVALQNLGRHDDGTRNDNIYANYFTIPIETKEDLYLITFRTEIGGITKEKKVFINVVPKLSFSVSLDKPYYILGDDLKISGNLNRKGTPLNLPIDLNFSFQQGVILDENLVSSKGAFTTNYRTTLIDEDGNYLVRMTAFDANGNVGVLEEIIEVLNPDATNFLLVNMEAGDINTTYEKGENISVKVFVKNISDENISGAIVKGKTSTGISFDLVESSPGFYVGSFTIPNQTPSGDVKIKVDAIQQSKQGAAETTIKVTATEIILEIIEPKQDTYLVGEEIPFRVRATYEGDEPVISETIFVKVNNETIELRGTGKGLFEGTYFVNENDEGSIAITIDLDDGYDNTASTELSVEVSGISYLFYVRTFGPTIALLLVALILILFFGAKFLKKLTGIQSLKKKEERIVETVKGIQTQYFVEGSMDKKNYDEGMEKWESELEDVRLSIKQLERKAKK